MEQISGFTGYIQNVYDNTIGGILVPANALSIWPLLVAFAVAYAIIYARLRARSGNRTVSIRHIMRALFPRRVFLHPSAIIDYLIFIINNGFLFFAAVSVIMTPALLAEGIVLLGESLGISTEISSDSLFEKIVFTIIMVLVWDFASTYSHYLKHKVPFLWEFHKVHHSAEVMTPVTALRRHPLDKIFSSLVRLVFVGAAIGLWYVILGRGIQPVTLFGAWAGIYLWTLFGYNLRHTHVWISYGDFWNRIFISPAQHQVHHSVEPEHYDKNFGLIFAFWDALFGTLYLPTHDERVKFGIEQHDMEQFRTLRGIYLMPFVKAAQLIGKPFRNLLRP